MHAVTYRRSNSSPAVCPDPPDPRLRRNKKKKKKRQKTAPFKQKRFFYAKEKGDLSRQARDKHERKTQEIKTAVCVCAFVPRPSILPRCAQYPSHIWHGPGVGQGWAVHSSAPPVALQLAASAAQAAPLSPAKHTWHGRLLSQRFSSLWLCVPSLSWRMIVVSETLRLCSCFNVASALFLLHLNLTGEEA